MRLSGWAVLAAALAIGGAAHAAGADATADIQRGKAAEAQCSSGVEPKAYDDCIAVADKAGMGDGFRAGLRYKAWDTADAKASDPTLIYGDDTEGVTVKAWTAVASADRDAALAHAKALGMGEADLFAAAGGDADAKKRWASYAK